MLELFVPGDIIRRPGDVATHTAKGMKHLGSLGIGKGTDGQGSAKTKTHEVIRGPIGTFLDLGSLLLRLPSELGILIPFCRSCLASGKFGSEGIGITTILLVGGIADLGR